MTSVSVHLLKWKEKPNLGNNRKSNIFDGVYRSAVAIIISSLSKNARHYTDQAFGEKQEKTMAEWNMWDEFNSFAHVPIRV